MYAWMFYVCICTIIKNGEKISTRLLFLTFCFLLIDLLFSSFMRALQFYLNLHCILVDLD